MLFYKEEVVSKEAGAKGEVVKKDRDRDEVVNKENGIIKVGKEGVDKV